MNNSGTSDIDIDSAPAHSPTMQVNDRGTSDIDVASILTDSTQTGATDAEGAPTERSVQAGGEAPIETAFRIIQEAREVQMVREAESPSRRPRTAYRVCSAEELPVGQKRIFTVPGTNLSVGVFHLAEGYFALRNICPHMGAPLCEGTLHSTHLPGGLFEFHPGYAGSILRCPWHGWEFDVVSGKALYDAKSRVATYPCTLDPNGSVILEI